MLCDNCGKHRAKIHYKEMKDDQVIEFHLCEECALEKGIEVPKTHQPFSFSNIVAGMAEEVESDEEKCDSCGLSYRDFRERGRLGCSDCYQAFKAQMKPLLRRIHGSNVHIGKSPKTSQGVFEKRLEIEGLKTDLSKAIEEEDFERAADIRDRIKQLEQEQGGTES
jgi:protein arginine kinase activator